MYKQFTYEQRIQLDLLLKQGVTQTKISELLCVSRKTIYNELNRNSSTGSYKKYTASQAQKRRNERRLNSNRRHKINKQMVEILEQKIGLEQWSPEQVVGKCKNDNIEMVSIETIYKYIYSVDKIKNGNLLPNLRQAHRTRRRRRNTKDKRGTIKDRVSIKKRPFVVEEQSRFGDFEGDTIVGKDHKSQVATIVERKTLYTILVPLQSKESKHVATEISKKMMPLKSFCHTLTFDNGKEFCDHAQIAKNLNIDIYFADPYSSWQRGCNEGTNGLIRQYIPKGTDLNLISENEWNLIQEKLNNRPRKKLGYKTPNEVTLCFLSG